MLRAAVRNVRKLVGRGHELRLAGADRDGDRCLTPEHRGVALQDARRFLHLGIGVDDHETADGLARDEIDDALVGQLRHDEIGQRTQRRIRIERARELLADRCEQAERAAGAPLRVVHAGALERMGALLAERDGELALGIVEDVTALEAEGERAEGGRADPQRHRRRRRPAAAAVGKALLALALVEEHGLAALDGLADRSSLREREAAPALELLVREPVGRHHIDGRPVLGRDRDHARVGAQQLAALAECDRVHGLGGGCARERGGEALQARGTAAGELGAPARLGLRCADEADDQLRECKDRQAHAAARVLDADAVIGRHEVVQLCRERDGCRHEARDRAAGERGAQHDEQEDHRRRRGGDHTARVRRHERRRDEHGDGAAGRDRKFTPTVDHARRAALHACNRIPFPRWIQTLRGVSQNAFRSALVSCRGPRCPRSRPARAAARAS